MKHTKTEIYLNDMERRATLISLHAYELEILGTFHLKIQAEEKEN